MRASSPPRAATTAAELLARGAALFEAEDLSGALGTFEEGARHFPDEWRFLCNAGTVLHRQRRMGEALRRVNQALALAPTSLLLHHKLGTWLLELDQHEAALRLFERAAAFPDAGLDGLLHLGVACLETKKIERALATIARALALAPESAEAHALHGMVLAVLGEREESDAALRRALALDPACAQAAYHLARRGTALDPGPLRARLADPQLSAAIGSKLHFALANLHDQRGEHAEAFTHFTRANALARRRWDPEQNSRHFDALIALCHGEFFARGAPARGEAGPIFLVGLPRTGSTLLEQILAAHPLVHAVGEHSQGLPRLARELPRLRPGVRAFPAGLEDLDAHDVERLAESYRASLPPAPAPGLRSVDKLLANFQMLGLIARLFPDARVVDCRRDLRDCGLSSFFLDFQRNELPWSYDLEHIARYYRDYERLMAHWAEHLPLPVLAVPYEGLVAEPEAWTRRVLEFVGLPWDPLCLRHERAQRPVFTASALQVRERPHARALDRWKPYAPFLGPLAQFCPASESVTSLS